MGTRAGYGADELPWALLKVFVCNIDVMRPYAQMTHAQANPIWEIYGHLLLGSAQVCMLPPLKIKQKEMFVDL